MRDGVKPPPSNTKARSWHDAFDNWARTELQPTLKKLLANAIIKDKPNERKKQQAQMIANLRKGKYPSRASYSKHQKK
jgi:hypothetical protein